MRRPDMAAARFLPSALLVLVAAVSSGTMEDATAAAASKMAAEDSRYKALQTNATLLKLLLEPHRDDALRAEIFDMLHSQDPPAVARQEFPAPPPPPDQPAANLTPDMQTELLQGREAADLVDDAKSAQLGRQHAALLPGGASLALSCTIVLLAYLALLTYKRYEMWQSGAAHQRLREDEPFNNQIQV